MNIIRLIKKAVAAAKDPNRDFDERTFLILAAMSEIMVFAALLGDIIMKENPLEILLISGTLIFVPAVTLICMHFDKIKLAIRITVVGLVFVILPGLFFLGGGLKGGGVIWIIFAFIYVGLVLSGKWRNTMFCLITLLSFVCFYVSYKDPIAVYPHSQIMYYVDTYISLVLVGILCFIMNWIQGRLFKEESERARKEAERAEELTRSQNRFFSSMSHEIRTPINSILGLNELILRDESASDDIVNDASGIQGAGKMLLALINDILDFSKMEAGSMDIVPVDYRIGDMLSEIVNMMWLRAHDKGLGFEVVVDPEVPMALYGDEVRIKQIIINLLNNAVKYTKEGRIELRVDSRDISDSVVELEISIADTGMGIKKEDLPYLFDAFKRVDEGKNRHIEGTGLGLSIVKQLVDLMEGKVSVNSVYGEGTTFTVVIKQSVTDRMSVGELNIQNQQAVKRSAHESSFLAPEARILIVDDNEMNLIVESRLLEDTDMGIDKALSGKEALDKSLKVHYDAIFMDHLMPEMDGIECLEQLRSQPGGLNRTTPVIILTANAGGENRELYNKAGFDGYLVKPVSGEAMEEILVRHISEEKIILKNAMIGGGEEIRASDKFAEKLPVIITSSSMCDLPDAVIKKLNIPIIPFTIRTEEGVFKDGIHMGADELIRHVTMGRKAVSSPPDENSYTEFFAEILKKTHYLIHISITTSMSEDFKLASEAAKSFDNVTVINSECLSSATGLLVLIAYKLSQQGLPAKDIISELESIKHRLKCSFVIETTEYMAKKGLISRKMNKLADMLNLHLCLRIRGDKAGIGGFWLGRTKRAYKKYIGLALPPDTIPDQEVVFITYVDVPVEILKWIEEEIRKTAYFEHVIFQQASAAISSNCGPGTFGILYFLKSNKSYNIASYIENLYLDNKLLEENDDTADNVSGEGYAETGTDETDDVEFMEEAEEDIDEAEEVSEEIETGDTASDTAPSGENEWYSGLKSIDAETAIKNSGSPDAFKAVLKVFYNSIDKKYDELDNSFVTEDWDTYTIKIHALKSSARLVGAMELGKKAERLEMAGKERDLSYIRDNHFPAMDEFLSFKETLSPLYEEKPEEPAEEAAESTDKPVADEFLMETVYEGLKDAAENGDPDYVNGIMEEIGAYAIPAAEKERFERVREKAEALDYKGIIEALGN